MTDTLSIPTLTVGNYLDNAFPGFSSPTSQVFVGTNGIFNGVNCLMPNPLSGILLLKGSTFAQDLEMSCSPSLEGGMYLRLTTTTGLAFYVYRKSPTNAVDIAWVTGINQAASLEPDQIVLNGGTVNYLYQNANANATLAGFSTMTATDVFTFGVVGMQWYLKIKGTEVLRQYFTQSSHSDGYAAGYCAANPGSHGMAGTVTINYPTPITIHTDTTTSPKQYDVRDYGLRSVASTTGSITGGTNSLVIASNVGFQVGDTVIVEIGGEAGAGAWGTRGVGGQYPTNTYATEAALLAATPAAGTYATPLDTNPLKGYLYAGGTWNTGPQYYINNSLYVEHAYATPNSLVSTITAVSVDGLTLTLTNNATVTATNANVYFDILPSFFPITNLTNLISSNSKLSIPAGTYAISEQVSTPGTIQSLEIFGQGIANTTIFAPKGCQSFSMFFFTHSHGLSVHDFKIINNAGMVAGTLLAAQGYTGIYAFVPNGTTFTSTSLNVGSAQGTVEVPYAFNIDTINNASFYNIDATNCPSNLINVARATSCTFTDIAYHNTGIFHFGYHQYVLDITSGSLNCTGTRVTCDSPTYLVKLCEAFSSTNIQYINCGGTNCTFTSNSSDATVFDGCHSTCSANCMVPWQAGLTIEGIFAVNRHVFPTFGTGYTISNAKVIINGYSYGGTKQLQFASIESPVGAGSITGGYPQCPPGKDYGGYFEGPDYSGDSSFNNGPVISIQANGATVTGIRVVGRAKTPANNQTTGGNISFSNSTTSLATYTTVHDCVADLFQMPSGVTWNNMSNALYRQQCTVATHEKDSSAKTVRGFGSEDLG